MTHLTPIETLHVHPRAYGALLDNNVNYVEHLVLFSFDELMQLPGMGRGLAKSVYDTLTMKGKSLSAYVHPRERRRKEFEAKYGETNPEILAQS